MDCLKVFNFQIFAIILYILLMSNFNFEVGEYSLYDFNLLKFIEPRFMV